jgi:acetyl-CoA carboxylase biotin carboxyl carrier protein
MQSSDGPNVPSAVAALGGEARRIAADLGGPLHRVVVRYGDAAVEIEWSHSPPPATPASAAAPAAEDELEFDGVPVPAPFVGTFYRSPEPGAPPFISVDDEVGPDTVIGIVEAMKLMNTVTAGRFGRVVAVPAADGEPVEYGQPLVLLSPLTGSAAEPPAALTAMHR